MTHRLKDLTSRNLEFHEKMAGLKTGFTSEKLLVQPFVNQDCAFFQNAELIETGFTQVDFDVSKVPFDFEDDTVTFIEVKSNHFTPN